MAFRRNFSRSRSRLRRPFRRRVPYEQHTFNIVRSGFTTSASNSTTTPDQIWTNIVTNTGQTNGAFLTDRGFIWGGCSFRYRYGSNTILGTGRTTVILRSYLLAGPAGRGQIVPLGGSLPYIGVTANNNADLPNGMRILWSGLDFIHFSSGTPQNAVDRWVPLQRARRKVVVGEDKAVWWLTELTTGTTDLLTISTDLQMQYGVKKLKDQ